MSRPNLTLEFNNSKYWPSSFTATAHPHPCSFFSNWEPLVHTGDPERPISPWARQPRGSGSPCADSRSVNRADGFWQIYSEWKSFILLDFFPLLLLFFSWNPSKHKKSCPSNTCFNIVDCNHFYHKRVCFIKSPYIFSYWNMFYYFETILPVVLWWRMMPSIVNYSWHPGSYSTFYHFLGCVVAFCCSTWHIHNYLHW